MLSELRAKLWGVFGPAAQVVHEGTEAVLDGAGAAAHSEDLAGSLEAQSLGECLGLALAGNRATVLLDGGVPDLELMSLVASRCTPMVAHLAGVDHQVQASLVGRGWICLVARNIQDAIDLPIVARRVAERTLRPVLIGYEEVETWEASGKISLPTPGSVSLFLGPPQASAVVCTPAQRLLFGDTRPLQPGWFDLDRPLAQGGEQGTMTRQIGEVSRRIWLDDAVAGELEAAFAEWAEICGRPLAPLLGERGKVTIVAQGAAADVASRVAAQMGAGVSVISVLATPVDRSSLRALLGSTRALFLERSLAPQWGEPDLMSIAHYGIGGAPLDPGALASFCRELLAGSTRTGVVLGVDLDRPSQKPKREALQQELRSEYPAATDLCVPGAELCLIPAGTKSLAIAADTSQHTGQISGGLGRLVVGLGAAHVRAARSVSLDLPGSRVDVLSFGPEPICTGAKKVGLLATSQLESLVDSVSILEQGGVLLLCVDCEPQAALNMLSPSVRLALDRLGATLLVGMGTSRENMLGSVAGALCKTGMLDGDSAGLAKQRARSLAPSVQNQPGLLSQFSAGVDSLVEIGPELMGLGADWQDAVSSAAAAFTGVPDDIYSLPRFWGQSEPQGADPFVATGAVPPWSAALCGVQGSGPLPVIDLGECSGCGDCWRACPDGAIGVAALEPGQLLDAGVALASEANPLRPMVRKLGAALGKTMAEQSHPGDFSEVMQPIFELHLEKMNPAQERRESLEEAFGAVMGALGDFSLDSVEAFPKEIFSLVVNPQACKGCGACAEVCEPAAITMGPRSVEASRSAQRSWRLWEQLPDTPGDIIARAADQEAPGALAALMMSRQCALAMSSGDSAEPGSGARLSVRSLLAVLEGALQPRAQRELGDLEELLAQITEHLQAQMAQALPKDMAALSKGMAGKVGKVDLAGIADSVDRAFGEGLVEAEPLQRLAEAAALIQERCFLLERGPQGLGRARYGLVIADSPALAWTHSHPRNPFQVPVQVLPAGSAARVAAGLARSLVADHCQGLRLQIWARALMDSPAEAGELGDAPRWSELNDSERSACPPLILLGERSSLLGKGLAGLLDLLHEDLPVLVVLLDDLEGSEGVELEMLGIAGERCSVLQSSPASPEHLVKGVRCLLDTGGSALLRLPAPSPRGQAFSAAVTMARCLEAVASRDWPLLHLDSGAEGVFGSRLSLEGNPEPGEGGQSWRILQELSGEITPFAEKSRAAGIEEGKAALQAEVEAVRKELEARLAAARGEVEAELLTRVRSRLVQMAGQGPAEGIN